MPCYCYLLECGDGSYYCGWTNDLDKRVNAHQDGKGARYTRAHLPVRLVYYETLENQSQAMKRERQIKRLAHDKKKELADEFLAKHE